MTPLNKSWTPLILIAILLGVVQPRSVSNASASQSFPINQLQLLESSPDSLLIELITSEYNLAEQLSTAGNCTLLEVPDYGSIGRPGFPDLPLRGALLGIPPGTQPRIEILEARTEEIPLTTPICPGAQPIYESGLQGEMAYAGQERSPDPAAYQAAGAFPEQIAEIEDSGFLRSQAVAQLRLYPFQYDPLPGTLRYYPLIRLRLHFDPPPQAMLPDAAIQLTDEGYFESTLQDSLLNYEQARPWRLALPSQPAIQAPAMPDAGLVYKIRVDQDGIYQLTYADLQTAGVPLGAIDPRTIKLVNHDQEIRTFIQGEADGKFDPADFILFYAINTKTKFTNVNVYWLTWGGVNGLRMTSVDGAAGVPTRTPDDFTASLHLEKELFYLSNHPSDSPSDHWYWDFLQTAGATVSKDYFAELHHLSARSADGALRGLLKGYAAVPQQAVRILLNNQLVHEAKWAAGGVYAFEIPIPQSLLVDGANKITIQAPVGGGVSSQTFLINWLELDFLHTLQADANRLQLDDQLAGITRYNVAGFTTNDGQAFDITNPQAAIRILNPQIIPQAGTFQVGFNHALSGQRRLLLGTPATWIKPLSILTDQTPDLRLASNRADYILIAHADFISQARRLSDFRSSQGLRTLVVDVQDVYDVFNGGVIDPGAIHDFLAYAYENWLRPAPSFVVLLGDGHYDFKNYLGNSSAFFIPPYLAEVDPYLGETAADNRFVTVSGSDILPDMHLGRLPANSLAEASLMVDKIISYETHPPTAADPWNKRVSFVADNPDSGGNFYLLSDRVADNHLPAAYARDKIYHGLNYTQPAATKAAILDALNQGRLLVSYIGHASVQWWAFEKLLTKDDLASMTNANRLAFFAGMTCLEGYYINPNNPVAYSLAESLLRGAPAGAIASFSATGLGVASGHDLLETGLFKAMFAAKTYKLGPAATQAKVYLFANATGFRDLVDTYLLFGDPATRLWTLDAPVTSTTYTYLARVALKVK